MKYCSLPFRPKNSEEKILHGVRGLFAEYERAKIAERFRLGKLRKAKEGHIITSEAPYGYIFKPKKETDGKHGCYEINEQEATVVKKIFSWIADDGLTLRQVVKELMKAGIAPRWSARGVWNTSTLSTLLRNKTYIGEGHYGSSYAVVPENPFKKEGYRRIKKTSRKVRPEEEWIKITTPALISRELFERAARQLAVNFAECQRNRKNEYLLSGKIYCGCGRRRAGEGPQRGKHLYYRCTDRVHSFPLPPKCAERGINARIADALVWKKTAGIMTSPELMMKNAQKFIGKKKESAARPDISIFNFKRDVEKLKDEEARYDRAYGAGLIGMEKLKEYKSDLRARVALLESRMPKPPEAGERQNDFILPQWNEVREFAECAAEVVARLNFEGKKTIVRDVIDKVVGTQEELHVYGGIPIRNLNYVGSKTFNRHRGTTQRWQIHPV